MAPFKPAPRCRVSNDAAEEGFAFSWSVGTQVERVLDDVSDIWACAIVLEVHDGDIYDIKYVDDDVVETGVCSSELRSKTLQLDLPEDVWARAGSCLGDKLDLCAFERLGRGTRAAALREAQHWWCAAYHDRFGRCCAACDFEQAVSPGALRRASADRCLGRFKTTFAAPTRSPSNKEAGPRCLWKARFIDRENSLSRCNFLPEEHQARGLDAAYRASASGRRIEYAQLDGRLRFGSNQGNDFIFDPRLGCLVADGQ